MKPLSHKLETAATAAVSNVHSELKLKLPAAVMALDKPVERLATEKLMASLESSQDTIEVEGEDIYIYIIWIYIYISYVYSSRDRDIDIMARLRVSLVLIFVYTRQGSATERRGHPDNDVRSGFCSTNHPDMEVISV
jgi:hypothetical protein